MSQVYKNATFFTVPRIITLAAIFAIGFANAHAAVCPEGQKCAPQRPTLAQCAERISLETGDTTYRDLLAPADRFIPLERAKAIADHPLCYDGSVVFIDADKVTPGPGAWTRTAPALVRYRKGIVTSVSFETTAVHNKVLAFLKHKVNGEYVVDADTPPAYYPVTAEVQDYEFWAITKKGFRSYLDWKNRFGFQVWLPLSDLMTSPTPYAPPAAGLGFAYRWNADMSIGFGAAFADCTDQPHCKPISLYGSVTWQVSLKRVLSILW